MPDSATAKKIRAALEHAGDVDVHRNRIVISNGEIIRLEGEVENIAIKRRASWIARQVADGVEVEDRLLVRAERQRTGEELLQAVTNALKAEPAYRDFAIGTRRDDLPDGRDVIVVSVDGSRVWLHGQVNSPPHRWLAEVIAWWTPGTADVENQIRVQPPREESDAELSDIIRVVFDKDPTLDPTNIQIDVRNREVTLSGIVNGEVNGRLAAYNCWYIPSVRQVRNKLQAR